MLCHHPHACIPSAFLRYQRHFSHRLQTAQFLAVSQKEKGYLDGLWPVTSICDDGRLCTRARMSPRLLGPCRIILNAILPYRDRSVASSALICLRGFHHSPAAAQRGIAHRAGAVAQQHLQYAQYSAAAARGQLSGVPIVYHEARDVIVCMPNAGCLPQLVCTSINQSSQNIPYLIRRCTGVQCPSAVQGPQISYGGFLTKDYYMSLMYPENSHPPSI